MIPPARPDAARPAYQRPAAPRREAPAREARVFDEDLGPVRPPNLHIEEITGPERSSTPRPSAPRSSYSRPTTGRSSAPRPYTERPASSRPSSDRPRQSSIRPYSDRPRPVLKRPASFGPSRQALRSEGGLARPFTTSSGKPPSRRRAASSKPGGFKSYQAGRADRPQPVQLVPASAAVRAKAPLLRVRPGHFTPRTEGESSYRPTKAKPYSPSTPRAERNAGSGRKPQNPAMGPRARQASAPRSKPRARQLRQTQSTESNRAVNAPEANPAERT